MSTLFASFDTLDAAQKAVGALLDQGAKPEDISLIANEPNGSWRSNNAMESTQVAESGAKTGITTTTAGDAVIGAEKGALVGAGLGVLAALAAIAIPGIGLVIGGGALAVAIAGAAGATAAGAAAGGIAGYLGDQGMGPEVITRYSTAFAEGSTILGIAVPSGALLPEFAEQLLAKYGATDIATYNGSRNLMNRDEQLKETLTVGNSNLDPIGIATPASDVVLTPYAVANADALDSVAANSTIPYVPEEIFRRATLRPIVVDPVTGLVERAVLIDPLTGFEHPVRYENGLPVYLDPTISEHPIVTTESDTVINRNDPTHPTVTLTGSERVSIL